MELKRININMKEAFFDYINEWRNNGEAIIPSSVEIGDKDFETFVNESKERETTAPVGRVPATTYYLMDEGKILGAINMRHELNEDLLKYFGHIGYGVRPSERGKGFASKMLKMLLSSLDEDKVLITCLKENIPSARVIESCGGILENEVAYSEGKVYKRYWIKMV